MSMATVRHSGLNFYKQNKQTKKQVFVLKSEVFRSFVTRIVRTLAEVVH